MTRVQLKQYVKDMIVHLMVVLKVTMLPEHMIVLMIVRVVQQHYQHVNLGIVQNLMVVSHTTLTAHMVLVVLIQYR